MRAIGSCHKHTTRQAKRCHCSARYRIPLRGFKSKTSLMIVLRIVLLICGSEHAQQLKRTGTLQNHLSETEMNIPSQQLWLILKAGPAESQHHEHPCPVSAMATATVCLPRSVADVTCADTTQCWLIHACTQERCLRYPQTSRHHALPGVLSHPAAAHLVMPRVSSTSAPSTLRVMLPLPQ